MAPNEIATMSTDDVTMMLQWPSDVMWTADDICNSNPDVQWSRSQFYQTSRTRDVETMTWLLTCIGLLGLAGNGLVSVVCMRFPTGQTTQYFVLAMAVADLFVCAAIIPYRITSYHVLLAEGACKFFEGLTYFSVMFSVYLLMAVAVDRYHAVCHPISYITFSKRNKHLILILAVVTLLLSIPSPLIAGHYVIAPTPANGSVQCFSGICVEDGQDTRFASAAGVRVYSGFLGLSYCVLVLIVGLSYTKVFLRLYKRQVRPIGQQRMTVTAISQSGDSSLNPPDVENDEISASMSAQNDGSAQTRERALNGRCRKLAVSHKRAAKILLLVTVAFIVTWIPFLLMKTRVIPNIVTIRLTFFVSNMVNPIIYSFTNKQFRNNVYKLVKRQKR